MDTELRNIELAQTVEDTIARLSREAHGGQQISFIESEHTTNMIAVHSAATVLFGKADGPRAGVDVIFQSDGEERYAFITTESWDDVCLHLVETGLHPEWSHARQVAFGSTSITTHKPRGLIVSQEFHHRRYQLMSLRARLARLMRRPIYTAIELVDGSTCWERWG